MDQNVRGVYVRQCVLSLCMASLIITQTPKIQ